MVLHSGDDRRNDVAVPIDPDDIPEPLIHLLDSFPEGGQGIRAEFAGDSFLAGLVLWVRVRAALIQPERAGRPEVPGARCRLGRVTVAAHAAKNERPARTDHGQIP